MFKEISLPETTLYAQLQVLLSPIFTSWSPPKAYKFQDESNWTQVTALTAMVASRDARVAAASMLWTEYGTQVEECIGGRWRAERGRGAALYVTKERRDGGSERCKGYIPLYNYADKG